MTDLVGSTLRLLGFGTTRSNDHVARSEQCDKPGNLLSSPVFVALANIFARMGLSTSIT